MDFIPLFLSLPILLFLSFNTIVNSTTIPLRSTFQAEKLSTTSQFSTNPSNGQPYKEKFFTQILDHFTFTPQSYHKFQQRYLVNDTYWGGAQKNAPIFAYMGNEGDIEWFAQNTGFMFDIAPQFKALLIFIEHRFYGESIPFGYDSKANQNASTLGYLTSTQALADYTTLILDLKQNLSAPDSPVLVFGGSYGGMLAAWFRLKYPHIAMGALASSAPILYFDNIASPYSFDDTITNDFKMCKAIDNPGNDTFAKLYAAANIYYNYSGNAGSCFDFSGSSDPHGLSGWGWQENTEMVMTIGGSREESMFPPHRWDYNHTFDDYPETARPHWITTEFGGHNIKRVLKRFGSNIIFFNGLRDPWSGGGVLKDISKSIVAIVAEHGAHHVDLRYATKDDPKWLQEVRKKEVDIITKWLSEYYLDLAIEALPTK